MSARTLSAALLMLAVSAGGAFAGDRSRMTAHPQPQTTGSIGGASGPFDVVGMPGQDPRLAAPRPPARSSFNPDTARARHYAR